MKEIKCVKLESGYYRVDSDFTTDERYIFKIAKGCWGFCYGKNGMTRKTFRTLREAKAYFGIGTY